jgi:hypothetical protein
MNSVTKAEALVVVMVSILADAARVRELISGYIQLLAPRLLAKSALLPSNGALASARWLNAVAPECPKIL